MLLRSTVFGILLLSLSLPAFASGVVESLKGQVNVGEAPVFQGQRIAAQSTITTGAGAQVFLRFDDGMQIVLDQNSLLRVVDYRYAGSGPNNRAVFELLRGAARVATGAVARDNPKQFFFRTPHTQLMVERPSDFTVALVNPAYITVHSGAVVSANAAGPVTLGQGSTSIVANSSVAPVSIAPSQMPQVASSAMSNLSTASIAPAGGAAPGAPAGGAAFAAADFAMPVLVIGGAAAGVAALLGGDDASAASHTTTTHH